MGGVVAELGKSQITGENAPSGVLVRVVDEGTIHGAPLNTEFGDVVGESAGCDWAGEDAHVGRWVASVVFGAVCGGHAGPIGFSSVGAVTASRHAPSEGIVLGESVVGTVGHAPTGRTFSLISVAVHLADFDAQPIAVNNVSKERWLFWADSEADP